MPAPKQLIEQFIQLANDMDEQGMADEADILTRTAQFMMDDPQFEELPGAEMWEEAYDDNDSDLKQFVGGDDDDDTVKHDPINYQQRIQEFILKLKSLENEVTGLDEFAEQARAIADNEFQDIYFETDNIIDDALTDYLKSRPRHLNKQIQKHAFPPQKEKFKKVLQDAGLKIF